MGIVIPNGYGQITWKGFHGATGQLWACTQGFSVEDVPLNLLNFAGDCYDAWGDNICPQQTSSTALLSCLVKLGPGNLGASAEFSGPATGGVDVPTLPSNVAVLVRKVTASGGRANRGRMFVPGMAEGSVSNTGTIGSPTLPNWQAAFDQMQSDLEGSSGIENLRVLHDESSPVATPTVQVSYAVQALVATQRRRLRR